MCRWLIKATDFPERMNRLCCLWSVQTYESNAKELLIWHCRTAVARWYLYSPAQCKVCVQALSGEHLA